MKDSKIAEMFLSNATVSVAFKYGEWLYNGEEISDRRMLVIVLDFINDKYITQDGFDYEKLVSVEKLLRVMCYEP